jgi:hypothetical protein
MLLSPSPFVSRKFSSSEDQSPTRENVKNIYLVEIVVKFQIIAKKNSLPNPKKSPSKSRKEIGKSVFVKRRNLNFKNLDL